MKYERGQNTHSKGELVKIPLLPNEVGKRSGTTGSRQLEDKPGNNMSTVLGYLETLNPRHPCF